jgi:hypothetical protein
VVLCRHIDPSLHGDGGDQDLAALCATPAQAQAEAERLQKGDPDRWNNYIVQAPRSLLTASEELWLSAGAVRKMLQERLREARALKRRTGSAP